MPSQETTRFPADFENIAIYTGNVMKTSVGGRNHIFHKKTNMEILAAIDDTLEFGFNNPLDYRYYPETKLLEVPDLRSSSRIDPQDRQDVEVTAKLFYLDTLGKEAFAQEAFMHLHKLLNVTHIDTLIVSDNTMACWKSLEELVKLSQVRKLGVTDLDRDDLEIFLDSGIEIKPVIDHVHVGECHRMPQDLIQLAKEKGIELLHNSDCTVILDKNELTDILKRHGLLVEQHTMFKPRWVLKYNVFVGSRNIVQDKGTYISLYTSYVVVASRV